jgi:molybdenum cofactor cytidylyltransferase
VSAPPASCSHACDDERLWAVVLAAGASRRLGRPKQLLRVDGDALVGRAVRTAACVCARRVVVVLGAHRALIEPIVVALDARVVVNEGWSEGMASSLRAGIAALPTESAAALLLTCDQPRVTADALGALARAWSSTPEVCVASAYEGSVGVPAIVPARLFPTLMRLRGDRGARDVLLAEGDALMRVAMPEAAFDVDDEAGALRLGPDVPPPGT